MIKIVIKAENSEKLEEIIIKLQEQVQKDIKEIILEENIGKISVEISEISEIIGYLEEVVENGIEVSMALV